jgi:hypothetical protein
MAFGHELVFGSTAFLLGALSGKEVTEARRTADQLARTGQFEALGDRLFGLLHVKSGRKQRTRPPLARGNFLNRRDAGKKREMWLDAITALTALRDSGIRSGSAKYSDRKIPRASPVTGTPHPFF